jgi:hypothetical protein
MILIHGNLFFGSKKKKKRNPLIPFEKGGIENISFLFPSSCLGTFGY